MSRPPLAVEALLRDLGPQLRRGGLPEEPRARFPTGLGEIDRLLGGGFPRGRLSEIAGAVSSGRTSLSLALLARTTRDGETCAVVDAADGFDPAAAEAAGVALSRVLWARAPGLRPALRSTERLLATEGFGLVLLNLAGPPQARAASAQRAHARPRLAWGERRRAPAERELRASQALQLARTLPGSGAALVLLSLERAAGSAAEVALELDPVRAHFAGTPALLEGLEVEVRLVRRRSRQGASSTRLRFDAGG